VTPQQVRQQRSREVDQRRGSARARGYTQQWDAAAKAFLDDRPLCLGCEALGWTKPSTLVDHVVPHRGDMVVFWDRSRWQPSCRWHHDVVKKRLEQMLDKQQATETDLWLSSGAAMALSLSLRGER
jgi:5-methylcytosine-specific restriction endonuclease McrA